MRELPALTGTPSQIEWAEINRSRANAEFDRVRAAFEEVALRRDPSDRRDIDAFIVILEDKRAEVNGEIRAGYFIKMWMELTAQVRVLITTDPRYDAARALRTERGCIIAGDR